MTRLQTEHAWHTFMKVVALCLFLICSACSKDPGPCIKSTGLQSKKLQTVSTFRTLAIYDDIEVLLIQDSINFIEVSAGENILPFIEVAECNGILTIRDNNKCKWTRSLKNQIKAQIHFSQMDSVFYNGTGNLKSNEKIQLTKFSFMGLNSSGEVSLDITADSLSFQFQTGVANLNLSGRAEYLYVYVSGDAPINCSNLSSRTAHVNNTGSNLVSVKVSDKLIVEHWHYGDVSYQGEPAIIIERGDGSGKLIKSD